MKPPQTDQRSNAGSGWVPNPSVRVRQGSMWWKGKASRGTASAKAYRPRICGWNGGSKGREGSRGVVDYARPCAIKEL